MSQSNTPIPSSNSGTMPANPLRPEIRIVDSGMAVKRVGSCNNDQSSPKYPAVYRKLRRHTARKRSLTSSPPCHCSIPREATMSLSFLLLVAVLQLSGLSNGGAGVVEAAFLNGPNPNLPKTTTNEPNLRYTFLTKPRDKHFTATGILPPLQPFAPGEPEPPSLLSPLPPRPHMPPLEEDADEKVVVTYTNDPKTIDAWLCRNVPYDGCFLGFDIERVPEYRSVHPDAGDRRSFAHAALIQLATPTACLVVQLVDSSCGATDASHHPKHSNECARILRTVLEDPSVVKAGCSIDEDLVLLHELWSKSSQQPSSKNGGNKRGGTGKRQSSKHSSGPKKNTNHRASGRKNYFHGKPSLQGRSRFDLGCVILPKNDTCSEDVINHAIRNATVPLRDTTMDESSSLSPTIDEHQLYKLVARRRSAIAQKSGLQGLCRTVLGVDLPKEKNDCKSDWARFPLTDDQITYAARDAWAGAAIATKLASMAVDENGLHSSGNHRKGDSPENSRMFSRTNLVKILRESETPLPELAQRHRQRKHAKSELRVMLQPYAKNLVLHQQNHRRYQELLQTTNSTEAPSDATSTGRIRVESLFVNYSLSSKQTLANYACRQAQLMEKSLPKGIRKRTTTLRQQANARIIDHKVIFEINLVRPHNHGENNNNLRRRSGLLSQRGGAPSSSRHHHHRGRGKRNSRRGPK